MTRLRVLVWAIMLMMGGAAVQQPAEGAMETLFPAEVPTGEWAEFAAQGFARPVTGVVYGQANHVSNGMPVGGVDTGCLDLETDGLLGYCTLFNSHVPRRGRLGLPYLGLALGERVWVLCRPGPAPEQKPLKPLTEWALQPDLGAHQRLWAPDRSSLPAWFKSVGEAPFDMPTGRVVCHSPAVLRWTSPVAGTLQIAGALWLTRDLQRPQNWELRLNGERLTQGRLEQGPSSKSPLSLASGSGGGSALTVDVDEGDDLELVFAPAGGSGDYIGMDLALTCGERTWDVARDWGDEHNPSGPWCYAASPLGSAVTALAQSKTGVAVAEEVRYFGHYPVADLEFQTSAPVAVGLRAWSPFVPGDVVTSMLPGAVFEVHLRNTTRRPRRGTVLFSFPGPTPLEAGGQSFTRTEAHGAFTGVQVSGPLASCAVGAVARKGVRTGGALGGSPKAWATAASKLPAPRPEDAGVTVAVDFSLPAGATDTVRFVVAWCAPTWKGGGTNASAAGNTFTHMYAKHYPDALATAQRLATEHDALLKRVLAWQAAVYDDRGLPGWLRDSLVNVLHLITEDGLWAQKRAPLPDWVREEDGLFGLNECPRECPQIECIPCSFYGSLPLTYFFPELQLSTIRGYQGYQLADGAPPWIFGGCTGGTPPIDFACPTRGYQFASNGISLAAIVDRFLLCRDTVDRRHARELFPMIKRSVEHTVGLRTTPSYTVGERIISMPDGNEGTEWFEAPQPGWAGMTAHIGDLHLAELRIAERLAKEVGDADFARRCGEWISAGQEAMEKRLWDERGYYLNFLEPDTGRRSDLVFGYQLDGEWILDQHGLAPALPEARIHTVLATIKRTNVAVTKYGAVNYANPDGTVADPGGYGSYSYFPPELLMLAMTYMYAGEREFGLDLAQRAWHNIVCRQGNTWDMPNIMRGDADTGERTYGSDYYQDMLLWALPSALAGQEVSGPCKPGGLVDRVLAAGRHGEGRRSSTAPREGYNWSCDPADAGPGQPRLLCLTLRPNRATRGSPRQAHGAKSAHGPAWNRGVVSLPADLSPEASRPGAPGRGGA